MVEVDKPILQNCTAIVDYMTILATLNFQNTNELKYEKLRGLIIFLYHARTYLICTGYYLQFHFRC